MTQEKYDTVFPIEAKGHSFCDWLTSFCLCGVPSMTGTDPQTYDGLVLDTIWPA